MAIKSFADKVTRAVFEGESPRVMPRNVLKRATVKLLIVHAATSLGDLNSPPANKLEELRGDRSGQHSIRINDQFRICFRWQDGDAYDVEIVDYH